MSMKITGKKTHDFIGREYEIKWLKDIASSNASSIIVLYGRRRVGKTKLLEQVFRTRNILKIEGIEGLDETQQLLRAKRQLMSYIKDPLIEKVPVNNWFDFFDLIAPYLAQGQWTLYFEEIQWLASYEPVFIADLKYAWDNHFKNNPKLIVILCGSSPSFITKHILDSKALYNRSQYQLELKPFSLGETQKFLKKRSKREVLDAYLTVGGIPEYLKWLNQESSVFLSLCKNSFTSGGFFVDEYERIFTSSLSDNQYYKKIIEFLSHKRFATREDIQKHLKIKSGGTLTTVINDLVSCNFIQKYVPYNLSDSSLLARYCIRDEYLHFYYKFIKLIKKRIQDGNFNHNPQAAMKQDSYAKWLGFALERFVKNNHQIFAKILGFESVSYKYGSFFNRSTMNADPGYQIDLVYDRADKVYTICEIKYTEAAVSTKVINEFEKKLELFPNRDKRTIHKVLIAPNGADRALLARGYFDRVISIEDFF